MGNRAPLSQIEKEQIYLGKLKGLTLSELARDLHCSWETARKWWRQGRNSGLEGLRHPRSGRPARGVLSQFDERVAQQAEALKRQHHGWGANRVRIALGQDPAFTDLALPKRSRLAAFFKVRCPECLSQHRPRPPCTARPIPTRVHVRWDLDVQEGIALANGETALICNLRDPYGAAPIASRAFAGTATTHARKLTEDEYRQVIRCGMTEWRTLPDQIGTDHELRLVGNPSSDFPGIVTLYLVGLGIQHELIRPGHPTDHAEVERGHRTLDNLALDAEALQDLPHLQAALDRERAVYLTQFPCQASDCAGRPPLVAHPELLHPRREYRPELEPFLFSMQRVYDYLATFTFERQVSETACVALAHQVSIGRKLARSLQDRTVWVRCDPVTVEWVIYKKPVHPHDDLVELTRRPITYLTYETITGLEAQPPLPKEPVQLLLPFPIS